MIKLFCKLAMLCALGVSAAGHAAVVGFDTGALIDIDNANVARYSEAGFAFSGEAGTFLTLDGIGSGASGGLLLLANSTITIVAQGGSPFSFAGLDAGLFDAAMPGMLTITGFFADSTQADLSLMLSALSGVNLADWTGLSAVRLTASADLVLDSLQLDAAAVPEPATIAMLLLGLAAMATLRRQARRL